MQRLSTTPFGRRPVSAGLLATRHLAEAPAPADGADKWQILRDLTTARTRFRLSSATLTVLQALLSFHPATRLAGDRPIIVFPSNRALGERAHGKSDATLRRHLAALAEAGLILRHDSPNGKRYAARDGSGGIAVAFGFDLRPLLVRAAEIAEAADTVRHETALLRRRREAVVLMVRDAGKLLSYARDHMPEATLAELEHRLAPLRQALRRQLDPAKLDHLEAAAEAVLNSVNHAVQTQVRAMETTVGGAHSERHYQNSEPEHSDIEPIAEKMRPQPSSPIRATQVTEDCRTAQEDPHMPLTVVRKACPALESYCGDSEDWPGLVRSAETVRPWLGISADAWSDAVRTMGAPSAAICVAGILERRGEIRSPGGYLRSLTARAGQGAFTPGPMIMALLKRGEAAGVRS